MSGGSAVGARRLTETDMAPSGHRYIVRNISEQLDWRPVEFIDHPPPSWVCSVCGVVVRLTCVLRCGHRLCGPCDLRLYELSGQLCCPLDGHQCPEQVHVVRWKTFPAKDLERGVYCWNKDNGCEEILALSELSEHFLNCKHHMVACPKCSMKILYYNLGVHLRSCSGRQEPSVTEGVQVAGDSRQTAELTALRAALSTATQQVKRQLGDLKSTISHAVNDLKETLHRDLEMAPPPPAAEVGVMGEAGREAFQKTDLVLHHPLKTRSSHQWTLKGYGLLKGSARTWGERTVLCNPVYLCHYHLQPGVYFERSNRKVMLALTLCLKIGEVDDYVQWPFNRRVMLSVVHPDTGEKRTIEGVPDGSPYIYSRPTTVFSGEAVFDSRLCSDDLERDGFVKNDQLDLRFELLTRHRRPVVALPLRG